LITHRKAGIREVHDRYLFSQGQRLAGKLAASERAGCAELDFLGVVGHLEAFVGVSQVVVGQPHIGVVGQRFVDQPVEEGVVIELPPVGRQRRLVHLRIVQQVERGARVGPLDHRVARHLIVGADHRAGAEHAGQGEERGATDRSHSAAGSASAAGQGRTDSVAVRPMTRRISVC